MTAGKTAPLFNTVNTEDRDPMDVAHEAKEQELCDALTQRDAEIRIAMAKLDGWLNEEARRGFALVEWALDFGTVHSRISTHVPDYLKDLDATRSVILSILNRASSQLNWDYCRILGEVTGSGTHVTSALVFADARQHCETILKTLELWNTKWNDQ